MQGATPVVAVTAVTAAGKLRERRQWELGTQAGLCWELRARLGGGEYEVACWPTPSPVFISV